MYEIHQPPTPHPEHQAQNMNFAENLQKNAESQPKNPLKPHPCPRCSKSFSSLHQLAQHTRVHTGKIIVIHVVVIRGACACEDMRTCSHHNLRNYIFLAMRRKKKIFNIRQNLTKLEGTLLMFYKQRLYATILPTS